MAAMQVLHAASTRPARLATQRHVVPVASVRGPGSYNFPGSVQLHCWALGSYALVSTGRSQIRRRARRARRSDSDEEKLEKWLPFVAAGAFGLLALAPTLIVGSMAAWWAFALAATVGSLLYFSVAVPMMISAALVGGIILPMLAANVFVAGSLIATLVASLATAGAAGLLVWVSLGNPLPMLDFSKKEKAKETVEEPMKSMDDPFTDWDRRFAASQTSQSTAAAPAGDFEALKRQGAPTYLNVSPKRPQG